MYRISVYILLAKQEDSSEDDKRCPFWCLPSLGKRSLLSCQQRTETSSPHPPQGLTRGTDGTSFPLSKTQEKHFMLPIPWAKGTRAGTQTFLQTQKPLFETGRGNARFGVAKYLISGFILLLHINFSGVCLARHVILDWSYVHRLWRVCESLFCCSYWAKSRLLPGTHAEKSVIWEQMVWLSEWEKERERDAVWGTAEFFTQRRWKRNEQTHHSMTKPWKYRRMSVLTVIPLEFTNCLCTICAYQHTEKSPPSCCTEREVAQTAKNCGIVDLPFRKVTHSVV